MIRVEIFQRDAVGPPPQTSQSLAVETLEINFPFGRLSSDSLSGTKVNTLGWAFLKIKVIIGIDTSYQPTLKYRLADFIEKGITVINDDPDKKMN